MKFSLYIRQSEAMIAFPTERGEQIAYEKDHARDSLEDGLEVGEGVRHSAKK